MRKVSRLNIAKPVELNSNECQAHLNSIVANPNISASGIFYRGKKQNINGTIEYTVVDSLKGLYKNKCSYCEKLTHKPKIDHHRPQGRVEGAGNLNLGYYWLSYEWTNLLPACSDCNGLEAKKNKYPLVNNQNRRHFYPTHGVPPIIHPPFFVYDSQYNQHEQPLLLHPEYCIPTNHFDFDTQGKIIGTSPEGIKTIEVLKLDNDDLNGWRRKIYLDHLSDLESIVRKFFRVNNPITNNQFKDFISDWILKLVIESNDDNLEYTLFRKSLLNKLDYYFISALDPVFQVETKKNILVSLTILTT